MKNFGGMKNIGWMAWIIAAGVLTSVPAAAQVWDPTGNSQLNGTYYFREVLYPIGDQAGDLSDGVSVYGGITFSGTGSCCAPAGDANRIKPASIANPQVKYFWNLLRDILIPPELFLHPPDSLGLVRARNTHGLNGQSIHRKLRRNSFAGKTTGRRQSRLGRGAIRRREKLRRAGSQLITCLRAPQLVTGLLPA